MKQPHPDHLVTRKPERTIFWIIFTIFCLVHVSNIIRLDVYPFVDLPNHLAEATIFKHINKPDTAFSDYYESHVGPLKPNILHILFCSLFGDIETGNRIYYILSLLLVPLSILALIRRAGGNPWFSLLSFLFIYNINVMWGFAGFTLAIPLVLMSILLLSLFLDTSDLKHGLLLGSCLVLLHYTHVLGFLFALTMSVTAIGIAKRKSMGQLILSLLPFLPAFLIFFVWILTGAEFQSKTSFFEFLKAYYQEEYLQNMGQRFSTFFWQNNDSLASDGLGHTFGLFVSLAVLVPFLASATPRIVYRHITDNSRRMALLLAGTAVLFFAILPDRLPEQAYLYQRFSVFVFLGIVPLLSFLIDTRRRTILILSVCCVSLIHCALWFDYYSSFKRETSCFTADLFKTATSSDVRLAAIIENGNFRDRPVYIHYQNYGIIWNHSIAVTKAIDYRFGSIRRVAGPRQVPFYVEWTQYVETEKLIHHYRDMDYILAYGTRPCQALSSSGHYRTVNTCDEWALYKRIRE